MIEQRFGESTPLSIGVEEEVMLLDAQSLAPVGAITVDDDQWLALNAWN